MARLLSFVLFSSIVCYVSGSAAGNYYQTCTGCTDNGGTLSNCYCQERNGNQAYNAPFNYYPCTQCLVTNTDGVLGCYSIAVPGNECTSCVNTCATCTLGHAYQCTLCYQNSWLNPSTSACTACTNCLSSQYNSGLPCDGTTTTDRTCAACSTLCAAGTGTNTVGGASCSTNADRVCSACSFGTYNDGTLLYCTECPCSSGSTFSAGSPCLPGSPGSYLCQACSTTCPAGTGANGVGGAGCNVNNDRVCGACPPLHYNDGTSLNCLACTPTCPVGLGLDVSDTSATCTSTHDYKCTPCGGETFNDGSLLSCAACTVCPVTTTDVCTASTDSYCSCSTYACNYHGDCLSSSIPSCYCYSGLYGGNTCAYSSAPTFNSLTVSYGSLTQVTQWSYNLQLPPSPTSISTYATVFPGSVSYVTDNVFDTFGCVGWKQTSGCVSYGPREPQHDHPCDTLIASDKSGFCDCGSQTVPFDNCNHAPTTCSGECMRALAAITESATYPLQVDLNSATLDWSLTVFAQDATDFTNIHITVFPYVAPGTPFTNYPVLLTTVYMTSLLTSASAATPLMSTPDDKNEFLSIFLPLMSFSRQRVLVWHASTTTLPSDSTTLLTTVQIGFLSLNDSQMQQSAHVVDTRDALSLQMAFEEQVNLLPSTGSLLYSLQATRFALQLFPTQSSQISSGALYPCRGQIVSSPNDCESTGSTTSKTNNTITIAVIVPVAVLLALITCFCIHRKMKRQQPHKENRDMQMTHLRSSVSTMSPVLVNQMTSSQLLTDTPSDAMPRQSEQFQPLSDEVDPRHSQSHSHSHSHSLVDDSKRDVGLDVVSLRTAVI